MSNNISEFNEKYKSPTIAILEETAQYYKELGDKDNAATFTDLEKATEEGKFSITVVGQFSAGKSTFLNCLMGEKFLPSFASETTATINFLRSVKESETQKEMVKVTYVDGTVKKEDNVNLETIEKYVSTRGDKVAEKISFVEIFYDSKFLNDGVCLVDSPGLNGLLANHEEITNNQVKKSHAIIFMFNAVQPGSRSDFKILESLRQKSNSIIIVLNQIDTVDEDQQTIDDVIEKLKKSYREQFPDAPIPEIWPIASLPALVARSKQSLKYHNKKTFTPEEKQELLNESRIVAFEDRLMRYLTHGEKVKNQLLEPLEKTEKFLVDTKIRIDDEVKTLESNLSAADIQEKIDALDVEVKAIEEKVNNISGNISSDINNIVRKTSNAIIAGTRDISEKYLAKISSEEEIEDLEDNYQRYINQIQSEYHDVYDRELDNMENEFKNMVVSKFDKNVESITNYLNKNEYSGSNGCPKLDVKVDTSIFEINYDIESYKKTSDDIIKDMGSISDNDADLNNQLIQAKRNLREYDSLKEERERVEKMWPDEIQAMGPRPSVTKRTVMVKVVIERPWPLPDQVKYVPVEKIDDTAQHDYDTLVAKLRAEYKAKIEAIEERMKGIPKDDVDEIERQKRELERLKGKLDKKLAAAKEEYERNSADYRKKRVRKAKSYLQNIINESLNKSRDLLTNNLKERKNLMNANAQFVIKNNLEDVFNKKRQELENLKKLKETDIAEKERQIQIKKDFSERAYALIQKTQNLSDEIEDIENDKIATE
ncbi:MAG: dynamin family protein [Bacteroidales bacterium]|nr:dynamin family protein [Bacteroidales bacterium]